MRQREGQRVGDVVALGRLGQTQQGAHHVSHLRLAGATAADKGLFDLHRAVFENGNTQLRRREQTHADRLPDLERNLALPVKILPFDGERVGGVLAQKPFGLAVNLVKPRRLFLTRARADELAAQIQRRPVFLPHRPQPQVGDAGVEADDAELRRHSDVVAFDYHRGIMTQGLGEGKTTDEVHRLRRNLTTHPFG